MTDPTCPQCDGFGYCPAGSEPGWYGRDWRVLLDPTVEWVPCPRCHHAAAPGLDQVLLVMLQRRLATICPVADRVPDQWQRAVGDGQVVWRWHQLTCLAPGPMVSADAWTLISPAGVLRGLTETDCWRHLASAGAPWLPGLGDPPA